MILTQATLYAAYFIVALIFIAIIFSRLYKRASKERAFVRTGLFGDRVVTTGCVVLPIFQGVIHVNLNTLKLEVRRCQSDALITKDRMRVDVVVECFIRVQPTEESIAVAAQTLGSRTQTPEMIRELIEGKVTDALRSASAEMNIDELHEQRSDFVQRVQAAVSPDLLKNGLELESVSLTRLDQTGSEYFDASNFFDSQGLTKLTETTERLRKQRNTITQDTAVEIAQKDLETTQKQLQIEREVEYAKMEQDKELRSRKAEQEALVAKNEAERKREADLTRLEAERAVEQERIEIEKTLTARRIQKDQSNLQTQIEQEKAVELARQDMQISISSKSKEESDASCLADEARARAIKAKEEVETVRLLAVAEREKNIQIIKATELAERDAVSIKVDALAKLEAADNHAKALIIAKTAEANAITLTAEANQKNMSVQAAGERAINEAKNTLNSEQITMAVKLKLIENLTSVIEASVKPMEKIENIKILSIDGNGGSGLLAGGVGQSNNPASLSDQVVNSALKYRTQVPLIDALLSDLGLQPGSINGLAKPLLDEVLPNSGSVPIDAQQVVAENVEVDNLANASTQINDESKHIDL